MQSMTRTATENHPPAESLELFAEGKLRGTELLNVLRHLEACSECFSRLPERDPQAVVQKLLVDDDDE